jgi:hypothetical protein
MKSKDFAVQLSSAMTEKLSKGCQLSGHFPFGAPAAIRWAAGMELFNPWLQNYDLGELS